MSTKAKALKLSLALISAATCNLGVLAPTVGAATGVAAYYFASPEPAQCAGCVASIGDTCDLNGQNVFNSKND